LIFMNMSDFSQSVFSVFAVGFFSVCCRFKTDSGFWRSDL